MKKALLALTLIFALLLTGCSTASAPGGSENSGKAGSDIADTGVRSSLLSAPTYPDTPEFDDYLAKHAVREAYPVADEVWDSMDDFAVRSTALALGGRADNALYSPLSLWFALAICAESAAGDTRTALLNALGLEGDTAEIAKALYNRLYTDNEIGALKLANSLWINDDYTVKQDFLDLAAASFYTHSYACDFASSKTGEAMGEWLREATGGLLGGDTVEVNPTALMTLFSAIYYSDQWANEFDKAGNTTGDFHNADGTVSTAEYMNSRYFSHGWRSGDGWISAGLSLKNGGGMTFVLPDEGVSVDELLSDADTLAAILSGDSGGGNGEVIFQIPKFEVSDALDLNDTVTGLGAGAIFDAGADFSPLSDDAQGIDSVTQQTTLSIDEKGVTAAAFTRIDYNGAALPEGRAELILDRPFLFYVTCGGTVLFIGTVNQM